MEMVVAHVAQAQTNVEKVKETVIATLIALVLFCVVKAMDLMTIATVLLAFLLLMTAVMTLTKVKRNLSDNSLYGS